MKTNTPRRSHLHVAVSEKQLPVRTVCAARLLRLLLLLLLTLPAVMQAQFNYTTNDGMITITGYTGPGGAAAIPDTINGLPVTRIGDNAFYGKTNLTSVTIPNSVTSIGFFVFAGCSSLGAITVDALNSVYSSVDGVLFNESMTLLIQCPGGKAGSYTIPNSVTSIGDYAFYSCTSLTSVTIPNSVSSIEFAAFYSCTSLTSVTIPNSVTSIAEYAFYSCTSLTSATIPNSVTSIAEYAFYSCTSLTSATIPNSVTSIAEYAFYSCASLTSVTIGNGVTSIGYSAFASCTSLTSVTIGDGVTNIGGLAFVGCTSLTSATIGNGVTSIGDLAFYYCTSLRAITVGALNSVYSSVDGVLFNKSQTLLIQCPGGKAGSYTMGNSVTSIGFAAFDHCTSLTSVTIGDGVTNIGGLAFANCTSLSAITVDALNSVYSSVDGVLFNKSQTLLIRYPGGKAGSYTVPNSVTGIGVGAFSYCTNLTGVYFQGNAPNVSGDVFVDANNVTFYYLPGTTGWGTTFAGRPAVLWNPLVKTGDASFGVRTNRFGFTMTGASDLVIVVEAATNLVHPAWVPVGTNTLTGGASYFSDPEWTNHPARFYRLRSP